MQDRTSQHLRDEQAHSPSVAIPSEEVDAELQRILSSAAFRNAPRHCRFLSFVVRRTLSGEADSIKEYLIGLEVFDRPSDYDPSADPIVRAEARRLRSRLIEYYNTEGKLDPVHIELPKGGYVPVFSCNGIGTPLEEAASDSSNGVADRSLPSAAARSPSRSSRFLISTILVSLAAVGIASFILIRMLTADRRPQSGRLDSSALIVTNADGKELWRKTFPDGFSHYFTRDAVEVWVGDLNGDGHSEVLLSYHSDVKPSAHSSVLICYSDRGKEVWRWTPGRAIPELNGDPPTFYIVGFGVLKASGPHSRIVVSSAHTLWYPHQIAILDSNGKLLSEYWHSGHLDHLTLADLDGDGREEIIATGINNGYRQATLVVLDPDRVFGASIEAARPELQIHGTGIAQERIRLLFPRSDLNVALDSYNVGQEATVGRGNVRFWTLECRQRSWGYPVVYEFDSQFHLRSATADDSFRGFHNEFFRNDKHPHLFSAAEENEFQKVRCLVGCTSEFVPVESH
jgi:hypothetical protein